MKKIILILFCTIAFIAYCAMQWKPATSNELTVTALNIGQGDAIYIRTPQGKDILIDGGRNRSVLSELGSVMPPYDHTLELVIATHPDADHIGGLAELPSSYTIETLITNGYTDKETAAAKELEQWQERGIRTIHAHRGWQLQIEENVWMDFLHPNAPPFHEDTNDDSIVLLLHYKEFEGLFTGDAPISVEQEVVQLGMLSDIDLLKVGHHGSKTSTSTELLEATHPEFAVISVGAGNEYGHPHAGPLLRLQQAGVQILRTDISGSIQCKTDGIQTQCQ